MARKGVYYQEALHEAVGVMNSTLPVREALEALVENAARALRAKGCSIFLLSPDGRELHRSASFGLGEAYLSKGPIKVESSMTKALEGQSVAVLDATTDPRVQYREEAKKEGIASILSVPIYLKEEIIGVLRIYTSEPKVFTKRAIAFSNSMANLVAVTVEHARLYETVQKSYEEVRQEILQEYAFSEGVKPATFAHPSEEEFARILDFYHIRWLYEPRSFPLRWEGGKVAEMFTPDFYLPNLDLYIELTTLKQSLMTQKNRKVRRLKESYPDVNIRLLNKKDYHRLLARYGYGPLTEAELGRIDRVLFNAWEIQKRVGELGAQITADYEGQSLVLVGVLKGMVCFMADLMRQISLPLSVDFMAVSAYGGELPGVVRIVKDLERSITGMDVLMVEDIVDTGFTLNYLMEYLSVRKPKSLRVCALLDKRVRRIADLTLDYVGFEIPDEFVVGYGLDYAEEYRNLPYIAVLRPERRE